MNKHILIVDDEEEIRNLLATFLAANGYRATPVGSAAEAIAVVERDRPDLLISDLQLEESDGLEMIEKIKTSLPELPVILLTGVLFDPEVVTQTLGRRISAFLDKTKPLSRILEEVRRLIAN